MESILLEGVVVLVLVLGSFAAGWIERRRYQDPRKNYELLGSAEYSRKMDMDTNNPDAGKMALTEFIWYYKYYDEFRVEMTSGTINGKIPEGLKNNEIVPWINQKFLPWIKDATLVSDLPYYNKDGYE